jgi:hypothetical protein
MGVDLRFRSRLILRSANWQGMRKIGGLANLLWGTDYGSGHERAVIKLIAMAGDWRPANGCRS